MKKTGFSIGIWLLCVCGVLAQNRTDVWAELQKVRDRYTRLDNYSVNLNYKVFKGHVSAELLENETGRFETGGSGSRYVLGDLELLRNDRYFVSIDRANKEMDIAPLTDQKSMPAFIDFTQMDSLMRKYDMVSQIPAKDGSRILRFDFSKNLFAEFERIDIQYLPSGDLLKAVLYYRQTADAYGSEEHFQPRLEVEYTQHNYKAVFAPDYFSEQKYFSTEDGNIDL